MLLHAVTYFTLGNWKKIVISVIGVCSEFNFISWHQFFLISLRCVGSLSEFPFCKFLYQKIEKSTDLGSKILL